MKKYLYTNGGENCYEIEKQLDNKIFIVKLWKKRNQNSDDEEDLVPTYEKFIFSHNFNNYWISEEVEFYEGYNINGD